MTQVISVVHMSLQLSELKAKRADLHIKLIDTNRLAKLGQATEQDKKTIKEEIAMMTSRIRSMEHDLSVLTLTLMQTASIEETPYGRVIKYEEK